jgi:outer membrane receptor protein involved in Fe transport
VAGTRERELSSYTLFNLGLFYTPLKYVTFSFRIENLADTYYEYKTGFPAPGRSFLAGLRGSWP